jgi:tRNA dimethylallyltransferase
MLDNGLLDEVHGLLEQGVDPERQPLRTIGYREPIEYLTGEIDYDEMVRLVKRNSRRYAKRQLTWFRRYSTYNWVDLEERDIQTLIACLVG